MQNENQLELPPEATSDFITVYTAVNPVNKQYDLKTDNSVIVKDDYPTFYGGIAVKNYCPNIESVMALLEEISENPNQCYSLGFHPEVPVGIPYRIESRPKLQKLIDNHEVTNIEGKPGYYRDKSGIIVTTRTKDVMAQSSYFLIDKDDDHPDKTNQSYDDWENDFESIMPGFQDAKKIFKPSNSSRATGGKANKWHIIVKAKNTKNISNLGHRILSTANSLGLGFTKIGKNDNHLSKTICDTLVFSQERLVYDGRATVVNSRGDDVSHLKLSPANIKLLPGDGKDKLIDTSRVKMMADDKGKFKTNFVDAIDKSGKTIKVKKTTYRHSNNTSMKPDDSIIIKHHDSNGNWIQLTPRQLNDNPDLYSKYDDGTGKVRCQSTYDDRNSKSFNGILRRDNNGTPILYDNGDEINYVLSDEYILDLSNFSGGNAPAVIPSALASTQPVKEGEYLPAGATQSLPSGLVEPLSFSQELPSYLWHPLQTTHEGKKPKSTSDNFIKMLSCYEISIHYDQIAKKILYSGTGVKHDSDVTDNANYARIFDLCKLNGIDVGVIDQYLHLLMSENEVNPVQQWIEYKPWDGVDRIGELFNTLTLDHSQDRDLAWLMFRKWLIGAVKIVQSKIDKFEFVLVLQDTIGGKGKTAWFNKLCPANWRIEGLSLDPNDKDTVKKAVSYWLVELGELDSIFKKSDIKRLMSFLSNQNDEIRLPYAKGFNKYKRRTAFIGTVNKREFLIDDSGDRRFWPIAVIAVNYEHNIDMQQLWAQVNTLDERHWLNTEENEQITNANKEFKAIDPVEEMLEMHFSKPVVSVEMQHLTNTEILNKAGIPAPTKTQLNKAGAWLRSRGYVYIKTNGRRGFYVPSFSLM